MTLVACTHMENIGANLEVHAHTRHRYAVREARERVEVCVERAGLSAR